MRFLYLTILFLFTAAGAQAAEALPQCGHPPEAAEIDTKAPIGNFCNIYDRQFAYAVQRQELIRKLLDRRHNYAAARKAAYQAYEKKLEFYRAATSQ